MAGRESKFSRWLYSRTLLKTWAVVFFVSIIFLAFGLTGIFSRFFPRLDLTHIVSAKTFSAKVRGTVMSLSKLVTIDFLVLGLGLLGMWMAVRRGTYAFLTVVNPGRKGDYIKSFYTQLRLKRGPKIAVLGGTTGIMPLLEGISNYTENISVITFPKREHLLQSLAALSGGNARMKQLLGFRFGAANLSAEDFGGLFLDAMSAETGSLEKALDESSRVLSLSGRVVPVTFDPLEAVMKLTGGKNRRVASVSLYPGKYSLNPEAVRVIYSADALLIGPGSIYSEVLPFFLIPGIKDAVVKAKCAKIFVANIMTQRNETEGLYLSDHVKKLLDYAGGPFLHYCVGIEDNVPEETLVRYKKYGASQVSMDWDEVEKLGVKAVKRKMIRIDEKGLVRHDSHRLGRAIIKTISI